MTHAVRPLNVLAAPMIIVVLVAGSFARAETDPAAPQEPSSKGAAPEAGTATAPPATNDRRPLVRLVVRNDFRPEDKLFPQLVEGRLVSDLADMETFRTAGHSAPDADYVLTCSIRNIAYDANTIYTTSRDADASSAPQPKDQVSLTMDVTFTLEDRHGTVVHEGKFSSGASHEFEISSDHTAGLLKEEIIDRAAVRIERLIRKKVKKV